MILKLSFGSRHNFSPSDLEGADQPEGKGCRLNAIDDSVSYSKSKKKVHHLKIKKIISMPLMMENPVRRPMVPPMRLSWASVLIFLSFSILSKVAVSK